MATRDMLGVWDDGSDFGPTIPQNARITFRMTVGETMNIRLMVVNNAGVPTDLTNAAIVLSVRQKFIPMAGPLPADISVTATLDTTVAVNRADLAITSAMTRLMLPGRYIFDVWMTLAGERSPLVPYSTFLIEPAVLIV